ncbi:galactonate dehydratase [Candidatus Poribacteria bacterium]|nr:galactonate dehydratase [Candidatus Poribacteria bacterium]
MKITAVKSFVAPSGHFFVKVETDAGIYGLGEGGLKRRARAMAEVVRWFEEALIGEDPFRIEHLWQVMFRGGFFPGGVVQSASVSAVDIALWDIKGKALGVPVYELLGGRTRDKVVCYPHTGGRTPADLVDNCRRAQDAGWRFLRWSINDPLSGGGGGSRLEPARGVHDGVSKVRAVREALGDEIEILIDVHTRLDPPASIQFCKGVEQYRPFFIEDPLRSENISSLRLVRQQTSVPLAIGEQFDSKWTFREAIEDDLMDYCRVDVCIAGGLTEARKIAAMCETHYIHLAPHNPLGPVSTAACLHLCLASPLVGVQELPRAPMSSFTEAFPVQSPFADGYLLVPDAPGLGVEFVEEALESEAPAPTPPHGLMRDDGSYGNW